VRQFALFCVSGVLAFVVDAGLTQTLVSVAGLDPFSARALSFPVAVTCTWLFNRRYTFRPSRDLTLHREWMLYVSTQAVGLAVNLSTYAVLVWGSAVAAAWPALAVAAGSVAGLLVNYLGAKRVAFADRR
jgi:putative flippase GtrA